RTSLSMLVGVEVRALALVMGLLTGRCVRGSSRSSSGPPRPTCHATLRSRRLRLQLRREANTPPSPRRLSVTLSRSTSWTVTHRYSSLTAPERLASTQSDAPGPTHGFGFLVQKAVAPSLFEVSVIPPP